MTARTLVTLALAATLLGTAGAQPPLERPGLDAGTVAYYVGAGAPGSGYQPTDDELAVWALEAWQRNAPEGALAFEPSAEETALVRV